MISEIKSESCYILFAVMNVNKINQDINTFKERIIDTLQLKFDQFDFIDSTRKFARWLAEEQVRYQKQKQSKKGNEGFFGNFLARSKTKPTQQTGLSQNAEKEFQILKTYMENKFIPGSFYLKHYILPKQMLAVFNKIKGKEWKKYYGFVKGPLMNGFYLQKKQHFHENIEKVIVNGLKFIMIEEEFVHKYQRNLLQEIMGNVFRPENSLSVVLKIIVESGNDESYSLYCYVEDISFKEKIKWVKLDDVVQNFNHLYVKDKKQSVEISDINLLAVFISDILVLPLQTLVSNYIVQVKDDKARVRKYNEQGQQEIVSLASLKEHPSLRNPLLFFKSYLREHSLSIKEIEEQISMKNLFAGFYSSLNIILKLIQNDFTFEVNQEKISINSLCFNLKVFAALWETFHRIALLPGWLKEVIGSIKERVTFAEIINHFCPIFNELMFNNDIENLKQHRQFFKQLDIQSYLATSVKKKTLQKYKLMFVNIEDGYLSKTLNRKDKIYEEIFSPIIQEVDLLYCDMYEVCYILHFMAKNKLDIEALSEDWRDKKIWEKCVYKMKEEKLPFIDIDFDYLAYYLGVDTYELDKDSFDRIQFYPETEVQKNRLKEFLYLIKRNYSKKSSRILGNLLQSSFKHKKYELCRILIAQNVRIQTFSKIFQFEELLLEQQSIKKENLLEEMKKKSPRMHRLYKWQKMMMVDLKEMRPKNMKVQTLDYGQIFLPVHNFLIDDKIINNLSRKDYMFDPNREIMRIDYGENEAFYIEKSNYPLLPHFYLNIFKKLQLQDLMPFFTSFFYKNQLFHIIEHLPNGINWEKVLTTHQENEIFLMTNPSLVSEAIILSIALAPGKVPLKDLIISPSKYESDKIFMMSWNSFYRKNFLIKEESITLTSKNSLLILDMMNKVIPETLVNKYSELQAVKLIEETFSNLSELTEKINQLKEIEKDKDTPNKQLLGFIFENQFAFRFAERLLKIKRILTKEKGVTHLKLLESVDPQASSFYEEIITSESNMLKREEYLFDEMWKKSFVNSQNLVGFFGSFTKLEEPENKFPLHYHTFCFEGPSQTLATLAKQIKKLSAFNDFLPKNLSRFPNDIFQYYIKQADPSQFSPTQKEVLFSLLRQKSTQYINASNKEPLGMVSFKNIDVYKEKLSQNFSYERTESIFIDNCKIGDAEVGNFFKILDNITYLNLKGLRNLKYIGGENSLFGKHLQIKHLKTIIIAQCEELISAQIKCDILENVKLKNNKFLENVYFKSFNLKNFYSFKNLQLNIQNLGIYILKGINVCACRVSCHGDLMKLYSDNYQIYITKLIKYFLDRFDDQNIKFNIIATLSKLKELDDDSYLKVGSLSAGVTGVTTFLGKYGVELQDKILQKLIKLYLSNPFLQIISTHSLTSQTSAFSKAERVFKLMTTALEQEKNVKSIKQLIIERPLKEDIDGLINVCRLLRFERFLSLTFENLDSASHHESKLIFFLCFEKPEVQKITLIIRNSKPPVNFIENIFAKIIDYKKINKLIIENSVIKNVTENKIPSVRELKLKNCQIGTYKILRQFEELSTLSLSGNKSEDGQPESIIENIFETKHLEVLQISGSSQTLPICFETFCDLVVELPRLRILKLNRNSLTGKNLVFLNKIINKTKIKQLVLEEFYASNEESSFDSFLSSTSSLKSLTISFEKQIHLQAFMKSLGANKSINNFHLSTNYEVSSNVLKPLNDNSTLEIFTSKQELPMWLRNKIRANSKKKSDVFDIQADIGYSNSSKVYDHYKIGLSLDGGGVRGLLLATELEYLSKMVGKPLHKIFDCVGGTSIGGILALTATGTIDRSNPVCTPADMMNIFQKYGKQIFKKTQVMQFKNLFDTKYSASSFESLLKNYFRDCRLSDIVEDTSVIVTAVNRLDNKDLIFRSTEALLNKEKDFYMRDVARATSAAPTYFPSAEIKNIPATKKFSLIDGGVGMNNPSKLVIDEIKKISANLGNENNYFLLSLGTGKLKSQSIPINAGIKDLAPIIDSFTESANYFTERDLEENYKGHFLRVSPMINLSNKEGELDNTDESVLKIYRETGYETAKKYFSNTVIFGKYRNMNLIEWLQENTARKEDI